MIHKYYVQFGSMTKNMARKIASQIAMNIHAKLYGYLAESINFLGNLD